MRTTKYYKVQPSVAERSGVADMRYRTADGMMILNEQDVRMIRLEPEEYLTGVVEAILTEQEAALLIEQGGRQMGLPPVVTEDGTEVVEDMTDAPTDATEETGDTTEETESDGYEVTDEPTEEPTETEATEDPMVSEEETEEPITEEVTNE